MVLIQTVVTVSYYVLCAFLAGILVWNFIREKKDKDEMLLILVVLIPLVLRLLRIK